MLRSRAHIGKMDSFFRERIYVVEQSCSSECTILTILYIMMTPIIYQETGLDPLLSYSRAFDVPLEGKSIATSRWANFLKIEPELKKIAVFLLGISLISSFSNFLTFSQVFQANSTSSHVWLPQCYQPEKCDYCQEV